MSPVQAYIDNAVRDLAHLQRGAAVTVTGHFGDVVSNNSTWIENVGTGRLGTPTDFGHIGYCFIGKHALAQDASFRDNDFGPPHKPFTKPISFEAKSRQIEFSLDAPAFGLEAGPVRHAVEAIQLAKAKTLSSVRQSLIVNNKMKLRFRTMEEVEEVDHSAAFAESDDEDAAKDGAGDANQAPRARLEQEEQFDEDSPFHYKNWDMGPDGRAAMNRLLASGRYIAKNLPVFNRKGVRVLPSHWPALDGALVHVQFNVTHQAWSGGKQSAFYGDVVKLTVLKLANSGASSTAPKRPNEDADSAAPNKSEKGKGKMDPSASSAEVPGGQKSERADEDEPSGGSIDIPEAPKAGPSRRRK